MSKRVWISATAIGVIGAAIGIITANIVWWRPSRQIRGYYERLTDYVKANEGPIDILLVGDSITQHWGSPLDTDTLNTEWKKRFSVYKTVNVGFGGDKAEDLLARLDRGEIIAGLQPRLVVLMIGINNLCPLETSAAAVADTIQKCVAKLRQALPKADVIVVKILPARGLHGGISEDVKSTNAALDRLKLDSDPKVHVLDLTHDFVASDGTLKKPLYVDKVHLSIKGYDVYAERLKPLVDTLLGGKG
jgi:lysophospholipase L1-like esterase